MRKAHLTGNQRQRRLYIITARNAIKVSHSNEIQIIFFLFPTPYSLLPTPYSRLPTPDSLLPKTCDGISKPMARI
ncbi:MAG: hypothetical protein F6J90_16555 [Moorea sp. SIOASIH]|uniref:hypothetical protein n=1 Tax=Moorena sp. SIOASIH TaxID=2607817 RepID=UPI0013B70A98|nr:hypothetical protein [Moorena sp. SIOASIH]NEO37849.1 hypothetical protein [Moorena sp. SIOASIH]